MNIEMVWLFVAMFCGAVSFLMSCLVLTLGFRATIERERQNVETAAPADDLRQMFCDILEMIDKHQGVIFQLNVSRYEPGDDDDGESAFTPPSEKLWCNN